MTRVSGTNIIKTPCCGALMSTPSYSSLNFSAWEFWTDGYNDYRLAPDFQELRRCLCGDCFLIGAATHVETIRTPKPRAPVGWESRRENWWTRLGGHETRDQIIERYDIRSAEEIEAEQKSIPPSPGYVANSELRGLIDSNPADSRIMEAARRLYWRYLNDPAREEYRKYRETHKEVDATGDSATFPVFLPTAEQKQNMEALVKLLETRDKSNYLELAELYRELGDLEAATRALSCFAGDQDRLHFVIDKLVSLKVRGPVRFNY
jgi:hypothetical protein